MWTSKRFKNKTLHGRHRARCQVGDQPRSRGLSALVQVGDQQRVWWVNSTWSGGWSLLLFPCSLYQTAADGGYERDVVHRMDEAYKAWGHLKNVLDNRGLGINAKKCRYEGVIVPNVLYEAEAWCMKSVERRRLNVKWGTHVKRAALHAKQQLDTLISN